MCTILIIGLYPMYFSESFGENVANLSIFHLQISQGLMESGLAMAGQGNSEEFPLFRENKRWTFLHKAGMKVSGSGKVDSNIMVT